MKKIKHEVTITSQEQFEYYQQKIENRELKSICLTNKQKSLSNIQVAKQFKKISPDLDITLNYSLVNHYSRNESEVYQNFVNFIGNASDLNLNEILLVSGNPKRKIDGLKIFEFLRSFDGFNNQVKLAAAFNPFDSNLEEVDRLKQKLKFDFVKSIYFQLGDDIEKINKGIDLIKNTKPETDIWVSILNPTPTKLNSLKFRPWHGVKYSDRFLNDINFAKKQNAEIIKLCEGQNYGVLLG